MLLSRRRRISCFGFLLHEFISAQRRRNVRPDHSSNQIRSDGAQRCTAAAAALNRLMGLVLLIGMSQRKTSNLVSEIGLSVVSTNVIFRRCRILRATGAGAPDLRINFECLEESLLWR